MSSIQDWLITKINQANFLNHFNRLKSRAIKPLVVGCGVWRPPTARGVAPAANERLRRDAPHASARRDACRGTALSLSFRQQRRESSCRKHFSHPGERGASGGSDTVPRTVWNEHGPSESVRLKQFKSRKSVNLEMDRPDLGGGRQEGRAWRKKNGLRDYSQRKN